MPRSSALPRARRQPALTRQEARARVPWARLAGLAALVAAAFILVSAPRAEAGGYVVTQCSAASPVQGDARWERSSSSYGSRSRCGTGDGLQSFHAAPESGLHHYGAWVWRAPKGTVFTNVQANASLTHQAGHRGQLVATRLDGSPVEFGSEHGDFRTHSLAGDFTQFHSWLRCVAPAAGRPCGRAGDDSAHAYVRGVFLRTDDRVAPALGITGGSLLDSAVIRGLRGLTFAAYDEGGGIRKVTVEANGTQLLHDVRNCAVVAGFATALTPCPLSTFESAAVPTTHAAFVTGPNSVTACAEDLALDGAANRACDRREVWVDNVCPGSQIAGGALEAGFGGEGAAKLVRSDEAAVIEGRLEGAEAGATVCALTRVSLAGAPVLLAATARTSAGGRFRLELPPGPNREVFVHHAFGDRVVARHGLRVRSSVRPALSVSPRHRVRPRDRLFFTGTIPGPACADRVVKVQARIGKRRWQVFRTDRADGACRFDARYRLRATRTARVYRFRALVPGAEGYPYERGHSATEKVRMKRRRG